MSPLSAALPLIQWIEAHDRWPQMRECCASQGLLHWMTYYRHFGTWHLSELIAKAAAIVAVSRVPVVTQKPCLGCGVAIVDEGHHVRFCLPCRKGMNTRAGQAAVDMEPGLSLVELRRYGKGRAGWDDTSELMEI